MEIREITSFSIETKTIIEIFLKLLVEKNVSISELMLKELIVSENSHLFFAFDESGNCMGMLTIGIYISPLGKKAWIEDVVVDEIYQGQQVGKNLIEFAIKFANQEQVGLLMLTSNPKRVAANNLYIKSGFDRKETNFYKMTL
jgi:GNAT superfamily N-acetyltransferase